MSNPAAYILIDDDPLANMIGKIVIKTTLGEVDIKTFIDPLEGLSYIENIANEPRTPTVLLLDINMPILSGWEFLEQFEKLSQDVKSQVSIYILSSSVDKRDKERAEDDKNVTGFLSKPLSREKVQKICNT
jgi:CheY-like chemotaxis protein